MILYLLNMVNRDFTKHLQDITMHHREKTHIRKSYSGKAMAICVSDQMNFAIDIEERRFRSKETVRFFLEYFKSFTINYNVCDGNLEWFYKVWTAMESYYKLTGLGFNVQKDFILDLETKSIYYNENISAYFDFFCIKNFLICLCSNISFSKHDVKLNCYGWSECNN